MPNEPRDDLRLREQIEYWMDRRSVETDFLDDLAQFVSARVREAVAREHENHMDFATDLYMIMVDPLFDGDLTEAQMFDAMRDQATIQRQQLWDHSAQLSLSAPASQSAQGAPRPPRDDTSPGDVIAAYPDGTIVLDDGITTHNAKRATEFLCEGCRNGWKRVKRANRVDTPKYGEEVWVHRKPFQAGYVYVRCLAAPQPEPPRWIPPKAEQLIRRLHEIAATSDEETGAALSETADLLAACFDEKIKVCPICGNEEVHPGTGMLTCECPGSRSEKTGDVFWPAT